MTKHSECCAVAVQLVLIDKHHLHVWDLAHDRFVAHERVSQQPLLAIFKGRGRGEFGVASPLAVDTWRVDQDLDYRVVLGGHSGPVIAIHTANGALVSLFCQDEELLKSAALLFSSNLLQGCTS